MELFEAINKRRSIREYETKPVSKEIIKKIIDAARLAPSANNKQLWEFVVVIDNEIKNKLYQLIKNNAPFLDKAPCAIAIFSKETKYYIEDCSAATQNILLAATALGLGSCWIAGDKKPYADDVRKLLNVPDNYKLVSIVVLGYSKIKNNIIDIKKRGIEDVLHWNKF